MKNRELIARLQELPLDLPVIIEVSGMGITSDRDEFIENPTIETDWEDKPEKIRLYSTPWKPKEKS